MRNRAAVSLPFYVTRSSLTNGDLVGELGFIDGTRHYASLVASLPTRVLGIGRDRLANYIYKQHGRY